MLGCLVLGPWAARCPSSMPAVSFAGHLYGDSNEDNFWGWGHVTVRRLGCWSQAKSLAEEEGLLSLSSLVGNLYSDSDNFLRWWGHVVTWYGWMESLAALGS
jgi:hypothetical protein